MLFRSEDIVVATSVERVQFGVLCLNLLSSTSFCCFIRLCSSSRQERLFLLLKRRMNTHKGEHFGTRNQSEDSSIQTAGRRDGLNTVLKTSVTCLNAADLSDCVVWYIEQASPSVDDSPSSLGGALRWVIMHAFPLAWSLLPGQGSRDDRDPLFNAAR